MLFPLRVRLLFVLFWLGNLSGLCSVVASPAFPLPVQNTSALPTADPATLAGVVIEEVAPSSFAAKAGLRAGDILLWYGGRPLPTPVAFQAAEENVVAQPTVKVTVKRGEQIFELDLRVTLAAGGSKLIVRPQLPPQLLSLYRAGRKEDKAKHLEAAIKQWQAAITEAEARGETPLATFFRSQIVTSYLLQINDFARPFTQERRNANLKEALTWAKDVWNRIESGEDGEAKANIALGIADIYVVLKNVHEADGWLDRNYLLTMACHDEMWHASFLDEQGIVTGALALPEYGGSGNGFDQKATMAKAKQLCSKAFEIRHKLAPNSAAMGDSYKHLADCFIAEGDAKSAYKYYSRACTLYRKFVSSSGLLTCLIKLGNVTAIQGDVNTARAECEEALALCRQKFPNYKIGLAVLYRVLARVAATQGDTRQARSYVQQTGDLWRKSVLPDPAEQLDLLVTQGLIATLQGDLESAEKYYEDGLVLTDKWPAISVQKTSVLMALGLVELARAEFQKSKAHLEQVYFVLQFAPKLSLLQATILNCLGLVYDSLKDSKRAEKYFQNAHKVWKRKAPTSPGMVVSLMGLANIHLARGELAVAESLCKDALTIANRASGPLGEAKIRTLMGQIYLRQQRPEKALGCFSRANFLLENQRQAIFSLEDRASLVQQNVDTFTGLMQMYLALGQSDKAFAVLERIHARSLADSIARRRYDLIQQLPPKLRDQQLALDDKRRIQENKLHQAEKNNNTALKASASKSLKMLALQQRRWENDLALALPRVAAIEYPQPINVKTAQRALPPGTLALAYAVDEKQTYLFALTQTRFRLYRLALSRAQLTQKITDARSVYTNINSTRHKFAPVLKDLYQQLLAPAQQEIDRAKTLLICPDGPLHSVPFPALMLPDGRFLIEKMAVNVIGSLTIYRQLHSGRQIASPKVLAIGNPAYPVAPAAKPGADSSSSTSMGEIQQNLQETGIVAKRVGSLFAPHSLVLTGQQATIANLMTKCADVDVLHLGCHGVADEQDPLNSYLALTPTSRNTKGLLHVWQIMRMRTRSRLVVLWACETGAGAGSRFEGIQGVARAFLTAGADNVLMSLWVVKEKPSSELLLDFYRVWKDGRGKKSIVAALREAQIRALKRDPRPYFWATFVLNGAGQ